MDKLTDDDLRSEFAAVDANIAQLRGEVATLRLAMENWLAGSLIDTADDPLADADEHFAGLARQAARRREPDATPHVEAAVYAASDALERLHGAVVARIREYLK
ncbi:hypothetical protein [Amorphus sp. MBR-141]